MQVALVHDWLTGMRGGERCLEVFCELFPDADLYTLLHIPGSVSPVIEKRRIVRSFIQHLPGAETGYRQYLPLFPLAIERFDFSDYDVVLSTSHCVAKGARARAGSVHICYCFTPMRYVWDRYDDYLGRSSVLARAVTRPVAAALQRWDRASSKRVHHFIAISRYVADRINRYYGRSADVIYPPVDLQRFRLAEEADRGFYLIVSALVPYKRVDLAVEAANEMGFRLLIVGTGPEESSLKKRAGRTVEFLGWQSDAEVAELYAECRAVLFPGMEDFGIVPLEAMASGRPVIAFRGGGALETIVPLEAVDEAPTGVFFEPQTIEPLIAAIHRFEASHDKFVPKLLRAHAELFDRPRFRERIKVCLEARLECQLC